jgi:hypothetical protein
MSRPALHRTGQHKVSLGREQQRDLGGHQDIGHRYENGTNRYPVGQPWGFGQLQ